MFSPERSAIVALGFLACAATPLAAAESIGKAVEIKTLVTGASGELAIDDVVYQDERIRTSKSGLGQFVFQDGTKLAVGWGSSVVIDKFVFDGSRSVKKLTLNAAKGTFRWISGNSKHSAYEILTPAGTIGVRGTAFDFYVGPDGTTAVVLLSGAASFCGAGGCQQLTRRCDCVVAKPNGALSDTRRVDRGIFKTLGNSRALPFLSGSQTLSASGSGGCGLASAAGIPRNDIAPRDTRKDGPTPTKPEEKPDEERPRPDNDRPPQHDDHKDHHDSDDGHHDRHHHDHDEHDRPHGHHGDRDKDDHKDRDHGHRGHHDKGKNE